MGLISQDDSDGEGRASQSKGFHLNLRLAIDVRDERTRAFCVHEGAPLGTESARAISTSTQMQFAHTARVPCFHSRHTATSSYAKAMRGEE